MFKKVELENAVESMKKYTLDEAEVVLKKNGLILPNLYLIDEHDTSQESVFKTDSERAKKYVDLARLVLKDKKYTLFDAKRILSRNINLFEEAAAFFEGFSFGIDPLGRITDDGPFYNRTYLNKLYNKSKQFEEKYIRNR